MTTGKVAGIVGNMVSVEVEGPVSQNEIAFVTAPNGDRLMAEVIKVIGTTVSTQVFESTRGVRCGDAVEFTGRPLEAELGPGILSRSFDGIQNDLERKQGIFLKRGEYGTPLDHEAIYEFKPLAQAGESVAAGDWLGSVQENWIDHKIMVPFACEGRWRIASVVGPGRYRVKSTVAVLENEAGERREVSMVQRWPVKRPVKAYREKPRPSQVLETGIRIIDTFYPMAEGGTGFIPGPFGCGKTVLQQALAKGAAADVVIIAACGERANEVVEIFTEFPELTDPRTGRSLMERTAIICNTSNMPVAAREASVYTAMTIAEYYRSMGLRVLLLADSTSRWAQALLEMSNRLEELPGPEAFPMDLGAVIAAFYARAGTVYLNNGAKGAITFVGTVSPAGGNLREPVTENTKRAARAFYALAQRRADSKRYPAVDPVDSYSKYLEYPEVQETLTQSMGPQWVERVQTMRDWVVRGREVQEQINILGDDGVPIESHVVFWKAETVDFALMQQDAFDPIDSLCPLQRQRYMLDLVHGICTADFRFDNHEQVSPWFKQIINTLRQMNYSEFESEAFRRYEEELARVIEERRAAA